MAIAAAADWTPRERRASSLPTQGTQTEPALFIPLALGDVLRDLMGSTTTSGGEIAEITDAIGARAGRDAWLEYLSRLPSRELADLAERLWRRAHARVLEQTGRSLGVPVTIRSDDGSLHLAWDAGRHYVDIDLFADGTIEWFYRDRTTETLDGTEESCAANPVPRGLVARLGLVAR